MAQPTPSPSTLPDGLPAGVIELATARWRHAEATAPRAGLQPPELTDPGLRQRLIDELTAPLRLEDWPSPNQPWPVTDGWVNVEVIDEDREAFDAFLASRPEAGPEEVAVTCQELRWPVTPYRPLPHRPRWLDPAPTGTPRPTERASADVARRATGRPLVVDLSTHWAGPLATALLAEAGAEVIKVDPSSRADGFRERPTLYRHLNGAKQTIDLDLRSTADRERFEQLVASADLLVESFSRRVLPNLGYDPDTLAALNPSLAVVSLKAFPAGTAEAAWLAYGPGVHAASGLGWATDAGSDALRSPEPAPVAYPDLIAGVTAFDAATALLAGSPIGPVDGPTTAEVSLAGSIAPLVCTAACTANANTAAMADQPRRNGAAHG